MALLSDGLKALASDEDLNLPEEVEDDTLTTALEAELEAILEKRDAFFRRGNRELEQLEATANKLQEDIRCAMREEPNDGRGET